MVTVTVCLVAATAFVADEAARRLGASISLALHRAGLKQEWVADLFDVPRPKLSAQLRGHEPFTYLRHFFTSRELWDETDFHAELFDIWASWIDRAIVPPNSIVLWRGRKPMAKAALPMSTQKAQSAR